jgi:hypothetical protein
MGEVGGSQGAGRRHGKFRAREISSAPAIAAAGKKVALPLRAADHGSYWAAISGNIQPQPQKE